MKRFSEKKYNLEIEVEKVTGETVTLRTVNITSNVMEKILEIANRAKTDSSGELVNNSKNSKILKDIMSKMFGGEAESYDCYNFFMLSDIWKYALGELQTGGGIQTGLQN